LAFGDKDQFLDKLYEMLVEEIIVLRDIPKETGKIPEDKDNEECENEKDNCR